VQLSMFDTSVVSSRTATNGSANKVASDDRRFHDWYRFVLSFPPHLVRDYFQRFGLQPGDTVLDPFCGTGTTLVEAKLNGIQSIGIEANSMAHFASSVKVDWCIDPNELRENSYWVAHMANRQVAEAPCGGLRTLAAGAYSLLLKGSISPVPMHKSLILLESIRTNGHPNLRRHQLLAFAKALVVSASNLHFGPEVGVLKKKRTDAPVVESWLAEIDNMVYALTSVSCRTTPAMVHNADAREITNLLRRESIDGVFTSPPYPNEKDYTRTTRLESVMLGFINNKDELRLMKSKLLRSNTRNVYKGDSDDEWITGFPAIQQIADEIEARRLALGKTSGFERQYARVTKLYFGGMARHFSTLRSVLKSGAYLGYVVGDQASYLQVMIRTGELLAEIARSLGYRVVGIDLFRTRLATATRKQLREEVVVLQWPGFAPGEANARKA